MQKLLYSPWQTLGVHFALTPIGQLHQSLPSPVLGDRSVQSVGSIVSAYNWLQSVALNFLGTSRLQPGPIFSLQKFHFSRMMSLLFSKVYFSRLNRKSNFFVKSWLQPSDVNFIFPPNFSVFFSGFCVLTSAGWCRLFTRGPTSAGVMSGWCRVKWKKDNVGKNSVYTLAYCEWRAAAPGLKPLRLPRVRSPGMGEGGDW